MSQIGKSKKVSEMKLSKTLGSAAIATGLVFGVAGIATAVNESGTDAEGSEESSERSERKANRSERRDARHDAVAEALGLEANALKEQLKEGATLADIAAENDISTDDVVSAMVAHAEAQIADAVADGKLTQEEADEKLAELEAKITEGVANGFERAERRKGKMSDRRDGRLTAVVDALGIEAEELKAQLRDGNTVAEIAEANGVDVDDVVAALVSQAEEKISSAVEAERLTAEEADEKLAEVEGKITEKVNEGFDGKFGKSRGERGADTTQETAA